MSTICVTSPHRDRYVKTPEYKVTAVQLEKDDSRKHTKMKHETHEMTPGVCYRIDESLAS